MHPLVNGVHYPDYDAALTGLGAVPDGLLAGVPTFIKDNVDVAGLPTNHGSAAFSARPAKKDSPFVTQYRSLGLTILGKSRLPEFGFSASTEYAAAGPVRNPWNQDYSAGASSGGSAALVATGAVPSRTPTTAAAPSASPPLPAGSSGSSPPAAGSSRTPSRSRCRCGSSARAC